MSLVLAVLNISACSGARSAADHSSFFPAKQSPAHGPDCAANKRAFCLAMVMSVRAAMCKAIVGSAQHHETDC